jgi:hypothetical protein
VPQTIYHQGGETIMAQGVLAFKYEEEGTERGMTALAGLPAYLDLAHVMGLSKSIRTHLHVRDGGQGWSDAAVVCSLILLNLAGGDCVEDLRILEGDEGFCRVLRRVRLARLSRKERREIERRWRKEQRRTLPSASSVFRYLSAFHDPQEEKKREPGKAFIPVPNRHLRGLMAVNRDFLARVQAKKPKQTATLDEDATVVATNKASALYCYEHYKAYQPLNVWWAEQGVVVHTEFRDGNVPAGHEQLRVLKEALSSLPEGIEKVYLRIDTAGYEWDLLQYCAEGESERFGVIEFAVGADVTAEFKRAVVQVPEGEWQPLRRQINGQWIETGQEWAEVCFVPNRLGRSKQGPGYRFLAIRELIPQGVLPGMEQQQALPFSTMEWGSATYKLFGIVTNRDLPGEELIRWHRERCGKSEEAHGVMKEDLAGGKLPSGDFGENAAWWWIMILALNLNEVMKRLVLGGCWVTQRMKAIRFALIHLPAWVRDRARQLVVRLSQGHPSLEILLMMRQKIMALAETPSG